MEQPQTHKNDPYNPDIFDQNIQNKHLELFKPYRVPRERCCQSLFGCTNKIAKKEKRGSVKRYLVPIHNLYRYKIVMTIPTKKAKLKNDIRPKWNARLSS